jgi:hypothetical protein
LKRTPVTKVPVGRTEFRYRVVLESDPCMMGTQDCFRLQMELLANMAKDAMLVMCGAVPFQTMKMRHDGARWVVELEAVVAEG